MSVAWTVAALMMAADAFAGTQAPATPAAPSKGPLAGTEWRLVEIQSMDDAVGTKRPADPSLYTMRLDADGSVNMRLGCNRANGAWSVEPGAVPSSGRFTFGPLAMTRALCPPPSLDETIAAQAQYIRGYFLKDGRLSLSLMADGGIWLWEQVAEHAFLTEPDPELEAAILKASPSYTKAVVEVPISRLPVIVSSQKTGGWRDIVRPESGGGAPPSYVRHVFDGRRYVEKGRTPGDKAPEGTRHLAGELAFDKGIPLGPRSGSRRRP